MESAKSPKKAANGIAEAAGGTMEDLLEDEAQEGEIELVVQGRTIPVRKVNPSHKSALLIYRCLP
jgi:hypothetical protein